MIAWCRKPLLSEIRLLPFLKRHKTHSIYFCDVFALPRLPCLNIKPAQMKRVSATHKKSGSNVYDASNPARSFYKVASATSATSPHRSASHSTTTRHSSALHASTRHSPRSTSSHSSPMMTYLTSIVTLTPMAMTATPITMTPVISRTERQPCSDRGSCYWSTIVVRIIGYWIRVCIWIASIIVCVIWIAIRILCISRSR